MSSRTSIQRFSRTIGLAVMAVWAREAGAQSLSVSASPPTLKITAAVAGSAPISVSSNTTTYSFLAPNSGKWTINANLDSAMPAGVTLQMTLTSPGHGANSAGTKTLSTVSQAMVTDVGGGSNGSASITYQLSATVLAGVVPVQTRIVSLTFVSQP